MLRIGPSSESREPNSSARKMCLRIRKKKQWTQGQLAMKLNIPRKGVENIEQGRYSTVSSVLYEKLVALLREIGEEEGEEEGEEQRGESAR